MELHVGTSGFSFPGWRAQVYPHALKSGGMFEYYWQKLGFQCVEINSSFYVMPAARSMASLARRSPPGFRFMAKVYHAFTHNLSQVTLQTVRDFQRGIEPLVEAGKLSGLLAQFPATFLPSRQAYSWVKQLAHNLCRLPFYVEFRNRRWINDETLRFLRDEGIGYCTADLPTVPPLPRLVPAATNGAAYVRLHGRNRAWYKPTTSRYDYEYSDIELRGIHTQVTDLQPGPLEIFYFANNCHGAAAVRTARRLLELYG